jgi:D-glycero-alpha-D-manno-heptose-7-phosphate kinase
LGVERTMIVTRAPFRISFAGGGTDLPVFYKRDYGAVLSTAIDKYVYVIISKRSALFDQGIDDEFRYRIRLSYSSTESVERPAQLRHPIVREALRFLDIDEPMDIATMADVPAGSGLGSSSTFTVTLLHALHTFRGDAGVTSAQLAAEAAHLEMHLLGRPVGKQDHYASAYGGLNLIQFHADERVEVIPVAGDADCHAALFAHLMMMYTGLHRDASDILHEQQRNTEQKAGDLATMREHAHAMHALVNEGFDAQAFGRMLHETWMRKRQLAGTITTGQIDAWYAAARDAGAYGGKVCGAGGGGFLLLLVPPDQQPAVRAALPDLHEMRIRYEAQGSHRLLEDGQPVWEHAIGGMR